MKRDKAYRILDFFIAGVICCLFVLYPCGANAQSMQTDFSRGAMYYHQGNFDEAIKAFQKVVNKNKKSVEGYIYLASAQLGAKQYQQVIETSQEGLDIDSQNIRLLLLEAEAYYRTDYRKTFAVYHQAEELLRQTPGHIIDGIKLAQVQASLGQLYQRRANETFKKGGLEKSIADYQKARKYSPDSLDINNNLAYTLIKTKRWQQASKVLEKAILKFPDDNKLLLMQGQVYRKTGQLQKMTNAYHRLYEKDESSLNNAIIYGQSLMMANKAQEANLFFHELIKEHPKEKKLYEIFKKISARRYDFGAKRNILKLQRKAFPNDILVAEELAQTHVLIEEYREAHQIYDSLAVSTHQFAYYLKGARTWLYEEKYDKAATAYQLIIKRYPEEPQTLIDLGLTYKEMGKNKKAGELFERIISLKADPEITLKLMEILVAQDHISKALDYANRLDDTLYSGIGAYYKLKYGDSSKGEDEQVGKVRRSLLGMIQLYSSIQQVAKNEASSEIQGGKLPSPPIFKRDKEMKSIRKYINDWYVYLSKTYEYNQAIGIIDDLTEAYPSSAMLYFFKGKLSVDNKEVTSGIESLKEAVQLGAKDPEVQYMLGNAYANLGEIQPAMLSYERAITLNKTYEKAYSSIVKLSQRNDLLDALCNRWLTRYGNNKDNKLLKRYLIEALHKADRFKEAKELIDTP